MANAVVEDYLTERAKHLNTINVLTNTAKERGGDPTDEDLEVIKKCQSRIRKLDELIEVLGNDMEMADEVRDKLARIKPGSVPVAPKYRSAGDLLWDCIHATYGSQHNTDDQDAAKRWNLVMKRAAEHMGTSAAETTPVAGGLGGLYVVPVVGPVIDIFPQGQPLLTALGKTPAPNSMTFIRPRIVDPDFKTGAGIQPLQKAELVSKKFDVKTDNVNLDTVGGYLNVSQQLMSLQPGSLDLIVRQLQRRVAWQGEAAGVMEMQKSTAEVPLAAGATAQEVLEALYAGAVLVYEATNALPTWIAYGVQGWAMLGSLTDAAGRPLFPWLGAANALGTSELGEFDLGPLGLRQIVSPAITDTSIWLGNELGMECYSYPFPVLEAVEPSVLGRQVAVAEALAFYRPTTQEADPDAVPPVEQAGNGAVRVGPTA